MQKSVRQDQIIDLLKSYSELSIQTLSTLLKLPDSTLRRDIRELKSKGIVQHVYGRVFLVEKNEIALDSYNVLTEQKKMDAEKEIIGKLAAKQVMPNDLITIDTGSTAERMIKYIDPGIPLTVLCYNYNALAQLVNHPNIKVVIAGGYYHPNDQTFESEDGLNFIRRFRSNKLFIAASGIHRTLGMTCANNYEVLCKRAILDSSQNKILVADSSKFDVVRTAYFADLKEIDTIITDAGIPSDWVDYCQSIGIRVLIAT